MNPKQIARRVLPKNGIKAVEETYRKGRVYALQAKQGFPAKGLRVIAVTGTNGKTTTCLYINELLKSAGYKTALLTTAVTEMAGKSSPNTIHRTVPLTADLVKFFKTAKQNKVDFVILEATSQALDQHKLIKTPVEVAVMTNLTQDHLDYHKSMEAYAASKARLFNGYMKPKHSVLNRDDEWFSFFNKQTVSPVITYGTNKASDLSLQNLQAAGEGSKFNLVGKSSNEQTIKLQTSLIGEFNAYNAAAAAAVGQILGLSTKQIETGIAALKGAPGRMEQVNAGQNFSVIVDYAHTPDALENVLGTLKKVTKGKVIAVFGATGDRDTSKRPIMGQIAAKLADYIFLTDDETYTEDPAAIRAAVMKGIAQANGTSKTTELADRREAIAAALKQAKPGDVVLLAGLGHQDYRNMGGKKQPWDDRKVAAQLIGLG